MEFRLHSVPFQSWKCRHHVSSPCVCRPTTAVAPPSTINENVAIDANRHVITNGPNTGPQRKKQSPQRRAVGQPVDPEHVFARVVRCQSLPPIADRPLSFSHGIVSLDQGQDAIRSPCPLCSRSSQDFWPCTSQVILSCLRKTTSQLERLDCQLLLFQLTKIIGFGS